jgi:predicted RNase H-like nuclease (RuvC/YqgF family)
MSVERLFQLSMAIRADKPIWAWRRDVRSVTITLLLLLFIGSLTSRVESQKQDPGACCDELQQRLKALEQQHKELEERTKTLEVQLKDMERRSGVAQVEARLASVEKRFNGKESETLELRMRNLERLNGSDLTLGEGGSSIHISRAGITIESNDITIRASGQIRVMAVGKLTLKGASISSN